MKNGCETYKQDRIKPELRGRPDVHLLVGTDQRQAIAVELGGESDQFSPAGQSIQALYVAYDTRNGNLAHAETFLKSQGATHFHRVYEGLDITVIQKANQPGQPLKSFRDAGSPEASLDIYLARLDQHFLQE